MNTKDNIKRKEGKKRKENEAEIERKILFCIKRKKNDAQEHKILINGRQEQGSKNKVIKLVKTVEAKKEDELNDFDEKEIEKLAQELSFDKQTRKKQVSPKDQVKSTSQTIQLGKKKNEKRNRENVNQQRYSIICRNKDLPELGSSDEDSEQEREEKKKGKNHNVIVYELIPKQREKKGTAIAEPPKVYRKNEVPDAASELQNLFEKKLRSKPVVDNEESIENEDSEYVYDYYELDSDSGERAIGTFQPKAAVNWLSLDIEDELNEREYENIDFGIESEDDFTDAEDSNQEDYYANDYPEEEEEEEEYNYEAYESENSELDYDDYIEFYRQQELEFKKQMDGTNRSSHYYENEEYDKQDYEEYDMD
ncbi:hypothetical protein K502DRAFT_365603 [Neoconidiobolus thromboides FSU 785]|nr:hypothetical protein K502DRAFT_365603 [Neoconidiobolus thromboides FSU 785]